MNSFEQLEAKVSSLVRRIEALECWQRGSLASGSDVAEASSAAARLRLKPGVLVQRDLQAERRVLASALRDRGWSFERVARVLGCAEKSVRRWLAARGTDAVPEDRGID